MTMSANLRIALHNVKIWLRSIIRNWTPRHTVVAILLLGLFQSLLLALIVPPWWHYDEAGHFEYVWLAAHSPPWPKAGQYDQTMRQQMAASMLQYGWYQFRGIKPDLSGSAPIPIGIVQTGDPPAYYFLASLPLRMLPHADITLQYFAARSVSILLYLLIILVVWSALGEVFGRDQPLRWMVPLFLALLPAFADTMTAVNDDVVAVLASCLFLWAGLRWIKRGYSFTGLLFLGLTLVLCYLSKNTAWFTFLLTPFVLILGLLRGRFTIWVIGIPILVALIAVPAMLEWGAPLGWYQTPAQVSPLRSQAAHAPLGQYFFQIDSSGTSYAGQLSQFLTPDIIKSLRGKTITLGVWLWADQAMQITSPYLRTYSSSDFVQNGVFSVNWRSSPQTSIQLTTTPEFYRFVIQVPVDAKYGSILVPYSLPSPDSKMFADGFVLAPGEHSNTPPHFTDSNGALGTWDGLKIQNLLRNGSAEQNNLRLRPGAQKWINKLPASFFDPSFLIATLLDRQGMGWYYRSTVSSLFGTFWVSLAADQISVPAVSNYFFMGLTLLGALGALLWLWLKRKNLHWDVLFFLSLAFLLPWILAVLRGVSGLEVEFPIISWARYADPAILPTALILCAGWLEWLNLIEVKSIITNTTRNAIFVGGLVGISALALMDAIQGFHPAEWGYWQSLIFLLIFQIIAIQVFMYVKTRLKT